MKTTFPIGTIIIVAIFTSSFGSESEFFHSADDSDGFDQHGSSSSRFGYLRPNVKSNGGGHNAIEADTTTVEEEHHEESVYSEGLVPDDHGVDSSDGIEAETATASVTLQADNNNDAVDDDKAVIANHDEAGLNSSAGPTTTATTTTTISPPPSDEQPGYSCGRSEVIELAKKKLAEKKQMEAQTGGKLNAIQVMSRSAVETSDADADYQAGGHGGDDELASSDYESGSEKRRRRNSDVEADGGDYHDYEDENTGVHLRPNDRFADFIMSIISLIPPIIQAIIGLFSPPKPRQPLAGKNITTFPVDPGTVTPHRFFPWQVTIQRSGNHHCGGALISASHVLTSACCFASSQNPEHYRIAFELVDRAGKKGSPYFREVDRITLHPHLHEPLKYSNDLAIVKLASPVDANSKLVPVCLPSRRFQLVSQERMIISGYGSAAGDVGDGLLRMNTLDYLNTQECKARNVLYKGAIDKRMICAVSPYGYENLCNATDFGGPLVAMSRSGNNFVLAGVMSFKSQCASTSHPLVFTSVLQQMGWIEKIVKTN